MTGWSVFIAAWGHLGRREKVGYLRRKFRVESDKADGRKGAIPSEQVPYNWARLHRTIT
jgi:hypothetical protein